MLLETVQFEIRPGAETAFESAFAAAQRCLEAAPGYDAHELQRCIEQRRRYLLLVEWRAAAEIGAPGYAGAAAAPDWHDLLEPYLAAAPRVDRYALVAGRGLPANPPPVINCD